MVAVISRRTAALALTLSLVSSVVLAQTSTYPNHTITLVLPFAAGSGTDTTTSQLATPAGMTSPKANAGMA